MTELGEKPFDCAVLNMVLHAVNDRKANEIIAATRQCLRPEGAIVIIAPTEKWLMQKLVDQAKDEEMDRSAGIKWVANMLNKKEITLPIKRHAGQFWPEPIMIFNRSEEEYANLLSQNGYGVYVDYTGSHYTRTIRIIMNYSTNTNVYS